MEIILIFSVIFLALVLLGLVMIIIRMAQRLKKAEEQITELVRKNTLATATNGAI